MREHIKVQIIVTNNNDCFRADFLKYKKSNLFKKIIIIISSTVPVIGIGKSYFYIFSFMLILCAFVIFYLFYIFCVAVYFIFGLLILLHGVAFCNT